MKLLWKFSRFFPNRPPQPLGYIYGIFFDKIVSCIKKMPKFQVRLETKWDQQPKRRSQKIKIKCVRGLKSVEFVIFGPSRLR